MEELLETYVIQLLDWEKVKLECINIGWTKSDTIKREIKLNEEAREYLINKKHFKDIRKKGRNKTNG